MLADDLSAVGAPEFQAGGVRAFGGPQEQTFTVARIDFFGLRPLRTLMNARARTVSVEPGAADSGTLKRSANGAACRAARACCPTKKSVRRTFTKTLPLRFCFFQRELRAEDAAAAHARARDRERDDRARDVARRRCVRGAPAGAAAGVGVAGGGGCRRSPSRRSATLERGAGERVVAAGAAVREGRGERGRSAPGAAEGARGRGR